MINHRYYLAADAITAAQRAEAERIPGMWAARDPLRIPWNIADQITLPGRWSADPTPLQFRVPASLKPGIWDDFALPFQRAAVEWSVGLGGGMLWASPGAGKTLMAIIWALAVARPRETILVVTKGAARLQWAEEVRRFTVESPFAIMPESGRRKRDETLESYVERVPRAFLVCGWEMLVDLVREGLAGIAPVVVFDEIHMGKASRRMEWSLDASEKLTGSALDNQSSAAYQIAKLSRYRLGTTATPVANRLIDLWGQFSLIEPDCWGLTATKFGFRYCDGKEGAYGGLDFSGCSEEYQDELLARKSRITYTIPFKVSHGQLPPKRRNVIRIPVSDQVKSDFKFGKEAKKLGKDMVGADQEKKASARGRLNELATMDASSRKRRVALERVKMYLECAGGKGKVILLCGRRAECETLAQQVATTGVQSWSGHGEVSPYSREEMRVSFMAHPGPCVLVGTLGAFGSSLNLQSCDAFIIQQLPWTPILVEQAEGRSHRLGMERWVIIEYLVAEGTIDTRIASRLLDKLPVVDKMVEGNSIQGIFEDFQSRESLDDLMDEFLSSRDSEDSELDD